MAHCFPISRTHPAQAYSQALCRHGLCRHAPGGYRDKDREEEAEGRRWRGENTARVAVPGISHFSGGGFHSPVEEEALRETQASYSTNHSLIDSMLNLLNKPCLPRNEAYYVK